MTTDPALTREQALGESVDILTRNGFTFVGDGLLHGIDSTHQRVFEDAYSVVAIVFFHSWNDLRSSWIDVQTSFVEMISEHFTRDDRKSWEAYLVLFSTDLVPFRENTYARDIRYNTNHVRKLLATGEQLKEISDVEGCLLPLLPIHPGSTIDANSNVLQQLPELISGPELSRRQIQVVVEAYERQESTIEALYRMEVSE